MQNIVESLRALKLYGMAETLPELLSKPRTTATLDSVRRLRMVQDFHLFGAE